MNAARQKAVNITNVNPVPISVYLNSVSVTGASVAVNEAGPGQKQRSTKRLLLLIIIPCC